jgi:MFS family permease
MFYQLKSFDETLPNSTIAMQAGLLVSAFTGAQFLTAMMWGRISDSQRGGRKMVLLIGLFGTMCSVLGFGFAKKFWQAMLFRIMGGALNGNIGVMRTMVSEIVQEKKYQSRAFLLFPMCFNIGVIIGPILGGLLADPAANYSSLFANVGWLKRFPYAPPNLVSACFLFAAALGVFFGLNEVCCFRLHIRWPSLMTGRLLNLYAIKKTWEQSAAERLLRFLPGAVQRSTPTHTRQSLVRIMAKARLRRT